MRKPVGTPHVLWIVEERLGIEIADLSTDFAIVPAGIKCIDRTNAAYAVSQIRPKGFEIVANRRDNTHTSDNYSALSHVIALKRGSVRRSTGSHADVLYRLEEFSFGPNGRRNDDFGLLELRNIACSYVAHASLIAPTRFWLPSSTSAGPKRICLSEPVLPTLMRVPRGRFACGVAMPQWYPRPGAS